MSNSLLITGTDTDVGKTFVTTALIYYAHKYLTDRSLGLCKLMQTGIGDRELYAQLFSDLKPEIKMATPLHFQAPLAPPIAAAMEGKTIDLARVGQCLSELQQQQDLVVIEALGGLGSPVTDELTVADLAAQWRLPTVLVVPIKLGAIAQTVANVALARSLDIDLRGIVLSCGGIYRQDTELDNLAPIDLLESLTQVSVLGVLPYIEDLTQGDIIAKVISGWDWELMLAD